MPMNGARPLGSKPRRATISRQSPAPFFKKFGGKGYNKTRSFFTKVEATREATRLRNTGQLARVFAHKTGGDSLANFHVYVRSGSRTF